MQLQQLTNYLRLCRVRIALLTAFSAASAFLLAVPPEHSRIIYVAAGVFLLACGASCLNQFQERETDALMPRTKNRPIPSGLISPVQALTISTLLTVAGLIVLYSRCGFEAAVFGLIAPLWYNGVYTNLKKISAFAAVPGALTGALPPAVGWIAAGGDMLDLRLSALCFFFVIWQVPHFWLFLMDHAGEYDKAGLPSITNIFKQPQVTRIVFHWISATAVSGLALSLFGLAQSSLIIYPLMAASAWLVWQGIKLLAGNGASCRAAFGRINIYMIVVVLLLISDNLLSDHRLKKYYSALASLIF